MMGDGMYGAGDSPIAAPRDARSYIVVAGAYSTNGSKNEHALKSGSALCSPRSVGAKLMRSQRNTRCVRTLLA